MEIGTRIRHVGKKEGKRKQCVISQLLAEILLSLTTVSCTPSLSAGGFSPKHLRPQLYQFQSVFFQHVLFAFLEQKMPNLLEKILKVQKSTFDLNYI